MQSAAFGLSPSTVLLRSRRPPRPRPSPGSFFGPLSHQPSPIRNALSRPLPLLSSRLVVVTPGWASGPSHAPDRKREEVIVVRASSSVPESTGGESSAAAAKTSSGDGLVGTLLLGSLFGLWYLFNIYFNIYNKQARLLLLNSLSLISSSLSEPITVRSGLFI